MTLPKTFVATIAALCLAVPGLTQTGPRAAEDILAALSMQTDDTAREFRAVAPFRRTEFLAASFTQDGATTRAAIHVITADGSIGAGIPLPVPLNYPGSRIDGLLPVGNAIIGIGHVAGGTEDRRGWIVRIEPDLTISAEAVLPVAHESLPVSYYYGGVLDDRGRLIVAGRADQPNFAGLGVRFGWSQDGLLQVVGAYPDGAGAEAGLKAGDRILRANGRDLKGLDFPQAMAALAGPADTPLTIAFDRAGAGSRTVTVTRKLVTGMTFGVTTVLDPVSLEVMQAPKLVDHGTYRAGLQDIGKTDTGQLVGVGWWETLAPDGGKFDKAWIVGLDANLDKRSDQRFGRDGDYSIAQRVHTGRDGRLTVIGSLNTARGPVAFASGLTMDGGGDAPATLTTLRELSQEPGLTDVFRGATTLRSGSTIVGGAFRSEDSPRFQAAALVLGSEGAPTPLFPGCAQSYVWDMASTAADALAIVGYCMEADGTRRAAAMWAPPREVTADAPTLAGAPRIALTPAAGGLSFDLAQADQVLVFAPAGTPGVLTLADGAGQLVDFAAVDAGKAALLAADLGPGRYVVGWASEGAGASPPIQVVQAALAAPEPERGDDQALAPEIAQALTLLGYSAARMQEHALQGSRSMALTHELAAFQLSRGLPALGRIDTATEIALVIDGALQAEARAREAAVLAGRLAQAEDAETLRSWFGPVKGVWRGEGFLGAATRNSLSYAGEWQLGPDGAALPSGMGVLENRTASERHAGMFQQGMFNGLGVLDVSRSLPTRQVGTFDDQARFTRGAIFENGARVATGFFEPGGRTLLRAVTLPR